MSEPLPCPFCGSPGIILKDHNLFGFYVACEGPKCAACVGTFPTKPMAVGAWNARRIRAEIIEECAAVAQRWSDEASEYHDPRSEAVQNVCRNLAQAIRNLAALDAVSRGTSDCAAAIRELARLDFSTAGTSHIQEARAALDAVSGPQDTKNG